MKTKEELNALKEECEALATKLKELTEDELKEVSSGFPPLAKSFIGLVNSAIGGNQFIGNARVYNGVVITEPDCKYYAFYESTNPETYGPACTNSSVKGTLPICANCPAFLKK